MTETPSKEQIFFFYTFLIREGTVFYFSSKEKKVRNKCKYYETIRSLVTSEIRVPALNSSDQIKNIRILLVKINNKKLLKEIKKEKIKIIKHQYLPWLRFHTTSSGHFERSSTNSNQKYHC